jgi:hypothetical protein
MEWQPGAWIECERTQERGQIEPYEGKSIRVDLGHGITLFGTSEALKQLGWKPISDRSEVGDGCYR